MAAPARFFWAPKWLKNTLAIYGFIVGSAPDTFDWIAAQLGLAPRWEWYTIFHHNAPWYWLIQPPIFMHVAVTDPPFHIISGWSWWPVMWSVEVLWVLFATALLYYAYRKE
jgi:hypothetical protein